MSNTKKNLKIAIVGYKFSGGGLEKVMSDLAISLKDSNFKIVSIFLDDYVNNNMDEALLFLGNRNTISKYYTFYKLLNKNKLDYIIDFRYRLNPFMELFFTLFFYRKFKVIYTVHSSKTENYFTNIKWIGKIIASKCYKIVTVSNFLKEKISADFGLKNVLVIFNGVNFKAIEEKRLKTDEKIPMYDYIVAMGRFVNVKQFDKLIETYSNSVLPSKNIHLVFLGSGKEENRLEQIASNTDVANKIHFFGQQDNPYPFLENAKFLVMSSKLEGFPMAILEALSSGIPVISFDCKSGPSEMIQNNHNGILVEDQNFEDLLNKMNTFVLDDSLYQYCKLNAKKSVSKFDSMEIKKQWLQILD